MTWAADFGVQWVDATTGVTHKLTFPRDALVALADALGYRSAKQENVNGDL